MDSVAYQANSLEFAMSQKNFCIIYHYACHSALLARAIGHETMNLFQAIIEQTSDAIIFSDCDGMIQLWNQGAATLFGHPASAVLGNSLDLIIPERLRDAHWQGFHKAIASRQTKFGNQVLATRSMHRDGSTLYVDMSFTLVQDPAETIVGVLAIARNYTARQQAERTLRARVAELEEQLKNSPGKD